MTLPVFQTNIPMRPRSKVTSFGVSISPTEALRALARKPKEEEFGFVVDDDRGRHRVSVAANRLGIEIETRKLDSGKYGIKLK